MCDFSQRRSITISIVNCIQSSIGFLCFNILRINNENGKKSMIVNLLSKMRLATKCLMSHCSTGFLILCRMCFFHFVLHDHLISIGYMKLTIFVLSLANAFQCIRYTFSFISLLSMVFDFITVCIQQIALAHYLLWCEWLLAFFRFRYVACHFWYLFPINIQCCCCWCS